MPVMKDIQIASLERRIIARTIDFFLVYGVSLGLADIGRILDVFFITQVEVNLLLWIVLLSYEFFCVIICGNTLGKATMRLTIISLQSEQLTQTQVLYRVLSLLIPFESIIGLFTPQQQCLHDLLAQTVVVQNDENLVHE